MSQGINKAILVGRTTEFPVVRQSQSGSAIANLTLVTNKRVKNEEKAEFHRLVFFGKLAEIVQQYVKKGDQLYCEGEIQTRSYDKDGIKRYSTEILVNQMNMLGSAKINADGNQAPRSTEPDGNKATGDFDEIPF
jgi:single-strand DNA-binding protein